MATLALNEGLCFLRLCFTFSSYFLFILGAEPAFNYLSKFRGPPQYFLQEKEETIGMGALVELKEGTGEIKRMYVKPEYRGKGLGREMLRLLLAKAKEYGLSEIYLETGAFMTTAQGLYRSMGFHDRSEYPETEVPPQLRRFWIFMEKQI
ncbi:MAG: GNAT family N-acetyltransferase [Chloroflexota bacterium]|nr:GNAT family N-acetyltransferase [Chloroflexota bacterium]